MDGVHELFSCGWVRGRIRVHSPPWSRPLGFRLKAIIKVTPVNPHELASVRLPRLALVNFRLTV